LDLSSNKLSGDLRALRPLKLLRHLNVAHNALTSDAGLAGLPLETVVLAHNKISRIDETGRLPALVSLDVKDNALASLAGLRFSARLLALDMRHNAVADADELAHLKGVQALQLVGNPMFRLAAFAHTATAAADRRAFTKHPSDLSALDAADAAEAEEAPATEMVQVDGAGLTEAEFRMHVLARLPTLLLLDGRVVTAEDKVRPKG
jgi:Leucine-rich repeat (LRR) protein